jgi:hypothetical protein
MFKSYVCMEKYVDVSTYQGMHGATWETPKLTSTSFISKNHLAEHCL